MKSLVDIITQRKEKEIELTKTEVRTETLEYVRREINETIDPDFDLGSQGV